MNPQTTIKVLIVDGQATTRDSLRQHLTAVEDIEVVGEADCGETALEHCEQLRPDIVLMDVVMPGLDGLTVTQLMTSRFPDTRVLIVTALQQDALIPIALRAGATGYLDKTTSQSELIEAIRAAAIGLSILSAQAVEMFLRQQDGDAAALPRPHHTARADMALTAGQPAIRLEDNEIDLYYSLTYRERQVLRLVLLGYTSAEIGTRLYISPRTAEKHRANMMSKLNVRNQYELTRLAYRMGVMPAEEDDTQAAALDEQQLSLLSFKVRERRNATHNYEYEQGELSARA